jgi:hypothetical protein
LEPREDGPAHLNAGLDRSQTVLFHDVVDDVPMVNPALTYECWESPVRRPGDLA